MKANEQISRPIVSAILEKEENGQTFIFLQTRFKPKTSPTYAGLFEIPAGGIDGYENVYSALKREVKEETGLEVINILNDYHGEIQENRPGDKSHVFKPFICQQVLETNGGLPWIGFVFIAQVLGQIKMQNDEAKDPQWISLKNLEKLLKENPEKFFPLQYPALIHYVSQKKK